MLRGRRKRTWCAIFLMLLCSIARASEPELTSPEPSMLQLTEAEIEAVFVSGQPYSAREIALIVSELQAEHRAELQTTATDAAAEALRPVLVELGGVTAERDAAVIQRDAALRSIGTAKALGLGGLLVALAALLFAALK